MKLTAVNCVTLSAAFVGVLAAVSVPVSAQSVRVDRIDVGDKGIFEITAVAQTPSVGTPTGVITAVTSEKLVQSTNSVPGRVGLEFGFQYVIVGAPTGATITLDIVNTYPAPGLKNPADSAVILENRYSRTKTVGETAYLGYGFENDWEVVPGTWTFAIWNAGRKLAEESFTVVKP